MSTLRPATIRLAYENPSLRPVLLPLLTGKQAAEDKVRAVNEDGTVVWVLPESLNDPSKKFKPYKHEEDTGKGGGAENVRDWTTWGVPKLEHEIGKVDELREEVSTLTGGADLAKELKAAVLKKMNRETLPLDAKNIDFSEVWSVVNEKRTKVNKALEDRGLTERVPRVSFEVTDNGVRVTIEGKKSGKEYVKSKDLFDALTSSDSPLNIEDDAVEALGALEEITGKYESELKKKQGEKGGGKKASLRTATIRLAYENPNLRPVLLPLLSRAGGMERQAAKPPKDLTPYGATAAELAAYKNKMQAMLQEAVQAFPPQTILGGPTPRGREPVVGEWVVAQGWKPKAALGLGFHINLPLQYGPRAAIFIDTILSAAEPATPFKKEVKAYWYTSVRPDWIMEPTAKVALHSILKGFPSAVPDYAVALQRIATVKAMLLAAAKAIS